MKLLIRPVFSKSLTWFPSHSKSGVANTLPGYNNTGIPYTGILGMMAWCQHMSAVDGITVTRHLALKPWLGGCWLGFSEGRCLSCLPGPVWSSSHYSMTQPGMLRQAGALQSWAVTKEGMGMSWTQRPRQKALFLLTFFYLSLLRLNKVLCRLTERTVHCFQYTYYILNLNILGCI